MVAEWYQRCSRTSVLPRELALATGSTHATTPQLPDRTAPPVSVAVQKPDDAAPSPSTSSRNTPPSRQAAAAAQILHMVRMLQAALAARHLTHVATRYVKALRNGTSCPTTVELRRKAAADMRLPAANCHGLAQASGTQALGSGTRPPTRHASHLCTHASAFAGSKVACLALTRRALLHPCILTSSPHNYGVNLSK